jgi:cytochrome P450
MVAQADLLDPTVLADPYPLYHRLRAEAPVHRNDSLEGWALLRHADVVAALRDPRLSADRLTPYVAGLPSDEREALAPLVRALAGWMIVHDLPSHTRLRALVSHAFTPRAVERLRERIGAIAAGLLDRVAASGRMDIMQDFAGPLPAIVIAELVGVPAADRERFQAWSDDVAAFVGTFTVGAEIATRAQRSLLELEGYFRGLVAERRRRPGDDLLSVLIAAEEGGDRLSEDELFANCAFLLFAGHETTTNLIGNGMLALLRHPDQLALLRDDPSHVAKASEEFLRYDGPVDRIARIATEDLEIGGVRISAGDRVVSLLGAANRDPARFPEPDRLDITRRDNRHVAFGHGPHFCVGAPLARLEAQVAFPLLLRRLHDPRLADEQVRWRDSIGFRGLVSLPVTFPPTR